jgi:hypothetical protein
MGRILTIPFTNCVRSKFLLALLCFAAAEAGAQQLVCGGFASFALPDSDAGHNAGGFALAGDGLSICLQVQSGMVFGQAGLYDAGGDFNDQCREPVRYTETDISVFPNPGTGLYTLRGSGITSCLVYDAGGRLVHRADYTAPDAYEQKLQIQFLSEGLYRLQLLGADGPVYQTSIIKINP